LNENRSDDITQISLEDNEKLIAQFSKKEVKDAIFQMKHNQAPGLDGFQQSSIRLFGKSSNMTLWLYLRNFIIEH
jgi:hypothetical protein